MRKLKYVFCNSNPIGGQSEIPITAIDDQGQVLQGTIHAATLNNWLAREVNFTPVAGLGTPETSQADAARRVG